jgi:VIT1/CCC1 family predicted Fe2+/Mn2+ transporter
MILFGVAAAASTPNSIMVAGVAALVAGALSMAAGEYVSVSAQSDAEAADIARERLELASNPAAENHELAAIYRARGLSAALAQKVADELTDKDPLAAHLRDELGLTDVNRARPVQAALASAASFAAGSAGPIVAILLAPAQHVVAIVVGSSLIFLAVLGALGAKGGGASMLRPTLRVTVLGGLAMALSAGVGSLFGLAQ